MNREQMLKTRKMLEELIGPIALDDPKYDDKRAFILFGAKDPNQTWENLLTQVPDPEIEKELREHLIAQEIEFNETLTRENWEE
jgi:hypothetical protein